MKKIIKLTESDLTKIIKRIVLEVQESKGGKITRLTSLANQVSNAEFPGMPKKFATTTTTWVVDLTNGNPKIGGVSDLEGKYFKSNDTIELSSGDKIYFREKGGKETFGCAVQNSNNTISLNCMYA